MNAPHHNCSVSKYSGIFLLWSVGLQKKVVTVQRDDSKVEVPGMCLSCRFEDVPGMCLSCRFEDVPGMCLSCRFEDVPGICLSCRFEDVFDKEPSSPAQLPRIRRTGI